MYEWQQPPDSLDILEQEAHVWRVNLDLTCQLLKRAKSLLSDHELQRGQRFIKPELRRRFWMAHIWKRYILASYLSGSAQALRFSVGEYGKPYLKHKNFKLQSSLFFNMTHSFEWALFIVTRNGEVGIDIEKIEGHIQPLELAYRFFAAEEYEYLNQFKEDRALFYNFYRMWTLKEAYIKALGQGLHTSLSSFVVSLTDDFESCLQYSEQEDNSAWKLFTFPAVTGYASALAMPCRIQTCHFWNLETLPTNFSV